MAKPLRKGLAVVKVDQVIFATDKSYLIEIEKKRYWLPKKLIDKHVELSLGEKNVSLHVEEWWVTSREPVGQMGGKQFNLLKAVTTCQKLIVDEASKLSPQEISQFADRLRLMLEEISPEKTLKVHDSEPESFSQPQPSPEYPQRQEQEQNAPQSEQDHPPR